MGLIYLVRNQINGKKYVGQTKRTLKKRMAEHLSSAVNGEKSYLYNAIRKYGSASFTIELLTKSNNLDEDEKKYIKLIDPEYNLTEGGGGVIFRYKRKAIHNGVAQRYIHADSAIPEGFVLGLLPAMKAKMAAGLTGKTRSLEAIEATAKKHRGMKRSPESRSRMKTSARNRKSQPRGSNHANSGSHWWNNGVEAVRSHRCPEGWVKGRRLMSI